MKIKTEINYGRYGPHGKTSRLSFAIHGKHGIGICIKATIISFNYPGITLIIKHVAFHSGRFQGLKPQHAISIFTKTPPNPSIYISGIGLGVNDTTKSVSWNRTTRN